MTNTTRPAEEEGGNPTALVIPAGYALVPLEPTPEMIAAMAVVEMSGTINGQPSIGMSGAAEAYAAMIKAAPGEIDRIGTSITIDYKQATELLEMFAGEPCGVTLNIGDGHSGKGLYAWWEAVPEEGALFLGVYDEEAAPGAATAAPTDTEILEVGSKWAKESGFMDFERNDFISCVRELLATPGAAAAAPSQAARDVLAERRRQIEEEGWTPEHDDEHDTGELADAAACYALGVYSDRSDAGVPGDIPPYWPAAWDESWWRPKDRRRNLVRSAALLLAEIDRIDRAAQAQGAKA